MKNIIICIVGESGSGKTMIAEFLEDKYNIPMIESRTTRPPRTPNESGHMFVSDREFDSYHEEDMLAFTKFGNYRYCCLTKDVDHPIMTYVIDEFGLQYFKKHFSDKYNIFAVRVFADDYLREEKVSQERMERDKGKFTLNADWFDYYLHNEYDSSIFPKLVQLVNKIKNKWDIH